ncbi:hypothetical protein, partial [Aeromonas salmonicida]|uniref:hypothetical protein n=1 Tax=Aeromonas salmonicida TaxID=645 RepID=UPI003D3164B0
LFPFGFMLSPLPCSALLYRRCAVSFTHLSLPSTTWQFFSLFFPFLFFFFFKDPATTELSGGRRQRQACVGDRWKASRFSAGH